MSIANTPVEISKDNLVRLGRVLMPPDPVVLSTLVFLTFYVYAIFTKKEKIKVLLYNFQFMQEWL